MCDIRYADDNSSFGFSNRQLGIPLLNNGPKRLAQIIGHSEIIKFLILDQQINSQDAVGMGIINGVVADGTGTV